MGAVKTLQDLFPGLGLGDRPVSRLTYDSRQCIPGSVFFAFPGIHSQGTDHVPDAVSRGAIAVVAEKPVAVPPSVAFIPSDAPRTLFARTCSAFHDHPERKLSIIGVTGTDGKSTTCSYLWQILGAHGIHAGLLGTVYKDDGTGLVPSPYRQSTPEADRLEAFLADCVRNGLSTVILECTSHALSDGFDRLDTIRYDLAVVTTVTSEHLEFHRTIAAYVDAKCNLVRRLKEGGTFVSTTANPHLDAFLAALPAGRRTSILHRDVDATVTDDGVRYEGRTYPASTGYPVLTGNAVLAAMAAHAYTGLPLTVLFGDLARLEAVDGRMEYVPNRLGITLVIDFAHTADAYEKLFSYAASRKGGGRLLALFGCAGERDTSKRAPMGRIASRYADAIWLTDEDPRGESSEAIDRDLLRDASPVEVHEISDRRRAIRDLLAHARKGDTVLLLGKGHEHSLEKGGKAYPWNERQEVEQALREKEEACASR